MIKLKVEVISEEKFFERKKMKIHIDNIYMFISHYRVIKWNKSDSYHLKS